MPRSNALVIAVGLFAATCYGFAGCGFAPAGSGGGSGASSGGPLGTGASNGGGLVGGGAAQNGHGAVTGMNCAAVQQPVAKLPPDILIVLDASGSMNNDISDMSCNNGCGATSKWAQMTPAINTVVQMTEGTVNWGLKFFADTDATCGVGNGVQVQVGTNRAAMIAAAITGRTAANGGVTNGSRTPTRLAENAGAAYLAGLTDQNPRFLLLATDGLPNCMPGNGDTAADDSSGAVMAVSAAATMGIPTFVVGIATSGMGGDTTLSNMANAGGYPRPGGNPSYYSVGSASEFVSVLQTLVGVAGSCTFSIPNPPPPGTDAAHIGVVINGTTELPKDTSHTNGWDYTSTGMTAVQVYGPTCDAILSNSPPKVEIVFKCIIG